MFVQFTSRGLLGSGGGAVEIRRAGRVPHLHAQLHGLGLLPGQSGSAHRRLQLGQRDAGLIQLAEVLRLETKPQSAPDLHLLPIRNSFLGQTFSLEMLSLLPMISAIRSLLAGRDSMAVKQSRA